MKKYKILTENLGKTFTYFTSEYSEKGSFLFFVDDRGTKRLIPLSKVIEVIVL